jgi:type II secretory ATPase GspE/PulE/Tfp pilus assembly ATPase PilB-like protein
MASPLLAAIEFGSYLSIIKLASFVILFIAALPAIAWVGRDSVEVKTSHNLWLAIVLGAVGLGAILWILIPIYVAGIAIYVLLVGAAIVGYGMHRDSLVAEYDKVMTAENIGKLFSKKGPQQAATLDFMIYTANRNAVDPVEPKTPDYLGWKLTTDLIRELLVRRVSDLSFVPAGQSWNLSFTIDGIAVPQPQRRREEVEAMMKFIKHLADLDLAEMRKPQTGKFTVRKDNKDTKYAVRTAGSTVGEQMTIVREEATQRKNLSELGMTGEQIAQLEPLRELRKGLVIIAGPRNTGVTTTFYSLMRRHDAFLNSVMTVEKKPAAELNQIMQTIYSLSDTGTASYTQKIQQVLRSDPDIVGVGDCSEEQTALLLTKAAKDKLIYVTLESPSIVLALGKMLKWVGAEKDTLIDVLAGMTCQRLLRDLCDSCKEAYEPNKDLLKKFNIPADRVSLLYRAGEPKADKKGRPIVCEKCQGLGFYGRSALFETVVIDEKLRQALKQCANLQEMAVQLRRAKMLYLQEHAIRRVIEGKTAINEVIREFTPPKPAAPGQAQTEPKA